MLLFEMSAPALGPTQPPIQWAPGFFPEGSWLCREVDHSPSSTAEVKNEWSYISTIRLHGVERDNFTFHLSVGRPATRQLAYRHRQKLAKP